jgi:hypothetical protein
VRLIGHLARAVLKADIGDLACAVGKADIGDLGCTMRKADQCPCYGCAVGYR